MITTLRKFIIRGAERNYAKWYMEEKFGYWNNYSDGRSR